MQNRHGMTSLPLVTIVVPCRNEARYITESLQSIVENDYPKELLQVLVIDGVSSDGTTEIIERFSRTYGFITRLENAARITPVALNLGIAAARGSYVLWMSAHNRYDSDYIRTCVDWALRSGADNVGGVIVTAPREITTVGRAIAAALSHRFGVGGSKFRTSVNEPEWADTVFGGCYRRDVFERIGLFNERLVRGQDLEFNIRLKRAGLRTLLVPTIRSTYYARSRPLEFLKHNWVNGVWAILPFRHSRIMPVSLRHLVPMFFVGILVATAAVALLVPALRWLPVAIIIPYLIAAIAAALNVGFRMKSWRLVVMMPFVFAGLHLSYGFGSLWGVSRTAGPLLRHLLRMPVVADAS